MTENTTDPVRDYVRHTLATLAYRGGKAVRDAPAQVARFDAGGKARTPLQILAHVNDLLDWALWLCRGQQRWHASTPEAWGDEVERFFRGLAALDTRLASEEPLGCTPEQLFQGPIADALTHVGQIALLRRLAGAPVRGENYFRADIAAGRVGAEQEAARSEFD
jgi:hypothetical protein